MRLGIKGLFLAVLAVVVAFSAFKVIYFVRDNFVYSYITRVFERYAEKEWNARLSVGRVEGNVWTGLLLRRVSLTAAGEDSRAIVLKADSVKLSYRPAGLISGNFSAEVAGGRFESPGLEIPLVIYHQGGITTIKLRARGQEADGLKAFISGPIELNGHFDADGDIILKDFRRHLLNIYFESKDLDVVYGSSLKMSLSVQGSASGDAERPVITGGVRLKKVFLIDGFPALKWLSAQRDILSRGVFGNATMRIGVHGQNVPVRDGRYIDAYVNSFFDLRKEADDDKPYIIGGMDLLKGIYKAYDTAFTITRGHVVFDGKEKPVLFDFKGTTFIRGYSLEASLRGGRDDTEVMIGSQPHLGYRDIASLIMFGEETDKIKNLEQNKLFSTEFSDILLKDLFFGMAKARPARAVSGDDRFLIECRWEY